MRHLGRFLVALGAAWLIVAFLGGHGLSGALAQEVGSRTNPQPSQPDGTKALREEMLTLIAANDRRYTDALAAQKEATTVGFATLREATTAAINAADRATTKAEGASDKRFESVNEFRKLVDDQQKTLVSKDAFTALESQVTELKDQIQKMQARGSGISETWGWVGLAAGIAIAAAALWQARRKS